MDAEQLIAERRIEATEADIETWERLSEDILTDTGRYLDFVTDTPTSWPCDMTFTDVTAETHRSIPYDIVTTPEYGEIKRVTITSPTNIFLAMAGITAMRDNGMYSDDQASHKIEAIIGSLEQAETFEGLFYNWYSTKSGGVFTFDDKKRVVSTVENAWLATGLTIAKNAGYGQVSQRAERLLQSIHKNLPFLFDQERGLFYGHLEVSDDESKDEEEKDEKKIKVFSSDYHIDVELSEMRIASLLSIGNDSISLDNYNNLAIFAAPGEPVINTDYARAWGGSAFEALMPDLFIHQNGLLDTYKHHIKNQQECGKRKARGHWGFSVCYTPKDGYKEIGVTANSMGSGYEESSVVTPHAVALALRIDPDAAIAEFYNLLKDYPDLYAHGLGFHDSVDTETGEVARAHLVLDQAMILIALFNHRDKNGGITKYTAQDFKVAA